MNSLQTCLIIDPDRPAAEALTAGLQQYQLARVVGNVASNYIQCDGHFHVLTF